RLARLLVVARPDRDPGRIEIRPADDGHFTVVYHASSALSRQLKQPSGLALSSELAAVIARIHLLTKLNIYRIQTRHVLDILNPPRESESPAVLAVAGKRRLSLSDLEDRLARLTERFTRYAIPPQDPSGKLPGTPNKAIRSLAVSALSWL